MDIRSEIVQDVIEHLKPSSDLTVSEWASEHRIMTAFDSPVAGQPFDNDRVPYGRGLMDAFGNPTVRMIVFKAGTQIGKTNLMMNMMGYTMSERPGPIMLALPSGESVDRFSSARIDPMIEASPLLRSLRMKEWRKQQKHYHGGVIYLATSNSSAQMSSASIEVVFADELKDWKNSVNTGGSDPVKYLLDRQKTFPFTKKAVLVSSPSVEDAPIEKYFQSCEQRCYYYVRCPHCTERFKFIFEDIDFGEEEFSFDVPLEKESSEYWAAARKHSFYKCKECEGRITDHYKPKMIRAGEWLREDETPIPEETISIGFQLSSLYSLDLKWGDIAFEFLESKNDRHKLENFITGWLGETWVNDSVGANEEGLQANIIDLEPTIVPKDTQALTCGIDCQKDHFYASVFAWSPTGSGTMIHHTKLSTFQEVSDLVHNNKYSIDGSVDTMSIWRAAIDTGGGGVTGIEGELYSMTEAAYTFVREHGRGKIFAIKGSSHGGARVRMSMLDKYPNGKAMAGGLALYMLNVDEFKDALFWRLDQEEGDTQRILFNKGADATWFKHMTSERKTVDKNGMWKWIKVRTRNDYLDTCVYNLALIDTQFAGGLSVLPKTVGLNTKVKDQMIEINQVTQGYGSVVATRRKGGWMRR